MTAKSAIKSLGDRIVGLEAELKQEIEWNGMKETQLRECEARIERLAAALRRMCLDADFMPDYAAEALHSTAKETPVEQAPIRRQDPCAHPTDARGGVDRDYCLLCGATVPNRK
jgi:hypothetical protein